MKIEKNRLYSYQTAPHLVVAVCRAVAKEGLTKVDRTGASVHALPSRGRRGRPPGLPKVPGSGRKSGSSNKVTKPVREIAAAYTEEAIHAIAALARNASNEGVRLRAWQELLDRGHGRPAQEVRGDVTVAQEDAPVDIVELARRIGLLRLVSVGHVQWRNGGLRRP